uniref:Ras homolog family member F, filopodia associated n=1 Tax=Felis catus TaxID=9685 RepID=A0ABI7Z3Y2_FELCA
MDAPGAPGPDPGRKELKIVIVGDGGCGKTSLLMVYSQGSFPEHYAPSVFEKYTARVNVGSKEVTLNLYDTAGQEDYDRLRPLSYQNTHLVLICYDVMNPTSYENVLIKWFPEVTHFCRGTPTVLIGCKTDLRKDKEQLRKLRAAQLEPITYMQWRPREVKWRLRATQLTCSVSPGSCPSHSGSGVWVLNHHPVLSARGNWRGRTCSKAGFPYPRESRAKPNPAAFWVRHRTIKGTQRTLGQSACEQIRAALYLECSAKFRENVEDVFREAAKVALSALKKAQRQKQHRLCLLL